MQSLEQTLKLPKCETICSSERLTLVFVRISRINSNENSQFISVKRAKIYHERERKKMADFRTSLSVLEKNVEINQNALKFG